MLASPNRNVKWAEIVRTLANFYTDKLDDADTIIPALQGLVTLASFPAFGPAEATTVIEG